MKDQKTNKKLSLKKITIAHLSEKQIGHIYGGTDISDVSCNCQTVTDCLPTVTNPLCETVGCVTVVKCTTFPNEPNCGGPIIT